MDQENDLFAVSAVEEKVPQPRRRGRPRKNTPNENVCNEKIDCNEPADSVFQPDPTAVVAPGIPAAPANTPDELDTGDTVIASQDAPVDADNGPVEQPAFQEPREQQQSRHHNNNRRDRFKKNKNNRNHRNNNTDHQEFVDEEVPPADPNAPTINIADLQTKSIVELAARGAELGIEGIGAVEKSTLICEILRANAEKCGQLYGSGYLEVLPDGFGFLRSPAYSYLPSSEDIYLSPSQIKRFALKTGDFITGQIRAPREKERFLLC